MDRYCLLGNPVEHSKSPWIHARFAELAGETLRYDRVLVPLDAFAATVQQLRAGGVRGCNVTVPFKFEAFAAVDDRSPRAALAGACNTLRFDAQGVHGDNTDGAGLVADIQQNAGIALAGRDLLLLGAGGAAAGVLAPLLQARPRRVVIANRTVARAQALVGSHAALATTLGVELAAATLAEPGGAFDLVVNATASSLNGGGVPVDARVLKPGALAYDMMYGPAAQAFLDWAAAHGAQGRDGLGMLVEQAAESFLVWRGVRPPAATVLAELRGGAAA